jgi:adenine-specific DNA-methyltransferase
MNFKENESATKLRGGYYTDPEIASFLLRWVLHIHPESILEPSCGDGVFLRALSDLQAGSVKSVVAFEIEESEVAKARAAAHSLNHIETEIHSRDFLGWSLLKLMQTPLFDAVIGNPPFIRYQYLDDKSQEIAQRIFQFFRLPFTKHTNAWVPFVISSLALLRPGGRLAMVVPSELFHVLHAESLRVFLAKECSRVLIFDPQELWFEETLQGAILLLAEKKPLNKSEFRGVGIVTTRNKTFLADDPEDYFQNATYMNGETVSGKWMPALLTASERRALHAAWDNPHVYKFDQVADVAVGIVTGANKFFLVPDIVVSEFGLDDWSYPMFGRSEHVPGVVYDDGVIQRNRQLGMPTNFIWFTDERVKDLPSSVRKYIKIGEDQGIHKRYKCRIREPWYSVPSVYSTSVGMLKRCHDFPRLILNKVQAYTTDTAYRVNPKQFDGTSLVFSFVNSLTALSAELEGRHYGGGVLELVPSEIRKLLVPIQKSDEKKVYRLDSLIRKGIAPELLLAKQDSATLKKIGFSNEACDELLHAWLRLRLRRQRQEIQNVDESEETEAI